MRLLPIAGLLALGLLPVIGRFLPATLSWGFHHAAYIPWWSVAILLAAWAALLIPPLHRALDRLLFDRLAAALFGRSPLPAFLAAAILCAAFVLLTTPTRLLGDGVLVGELAGLGNPFRIHDMMDYLLHRLALTAIGKAGSKEVSFQIYRWGSWIAGFLAALTALLILRRARMNPAGKMLAFSLFILAAPTLIYCGYVESYAYLSIGMLGFLWTGAMAQRGECPPWVPGLFYGIAFFFHTTAVFALPALLLLTFFPGARRKRRPAWPLQILLPALALPAAAIAIHLALGYDAGWFRRDFIESKNQRQLLIGLSGPHGLLGLRHLKDVANWLLLVAPVTGWLIVSKRRVLLARLREPEIAFLAIQVAAFLAPFLLLDRKLGAARDWDLMTPQVAGFALLAARLWEADLARGGSAAGGGPAAGGAPLAEGAPAAEGGRLPSVRLAAFWAALLLTAPWLAMNASREATVRRFDEVRRDFPTFARAYGAEELGKYYYERKEYETSLAYYRECVETYPGNARTRILLGTSYFILNRIDEAQAQYDKALEIDPDNWMALDMKARLALRANDTKAALGFFRRLAPSNPRDPEIWAGYGYAAFYQKAYPEAVEAFLRASQFRFDPRYLYHAGIARALQGEHDAAIELLTRSWEAGMEETMVASALATTLESRYASIERRGESPSRDDLVRARDHLRRAAAAKPEEKHLSERLLHIEEVLAGRTPALILQGP